MNLATYLQDSKGLTLIGLPNGFVVHSMSKCDDQPRWQMHVITPACTANTPATDFRGNPMSIGGEPGKIYFGYIVNNQSFSSFLQIDPDGKLSYDLPDELKAKDVSPLPEINCQ